MSVFSARLRSTGRHQKPAVGDDKADTGHCSLKRLIAPGIVGRFAKSK
jgi:hypothetical protein